MHLKILETIHAWASINIKARHAAKSSGSRNVLYSHGTNHRLSHPFDSRIHCVNMTNLIPVHSDWKWSKTSPFTKLWVWRTILRFEHCSHSHIFCPALGWFIEVKGVLRTFSSSSSWPVYMSPKRNVGRGAFTTPSYLIYPTSKTLKQGAITFEHVGGCSGIWWDLFSPLLMRRVDGS